RRGPTSRLGGQPTVLPPVHIDADLLKVTSIPEPVMLRTQDNLSGISRPASPIPFGMKVTEVLEKLQKNPELDLIPVVNSGRPVGLVERYSFLNKIMKSIYGMALYGKLRIVDFLEQTPVVVDINTNLDAVSRKVTSHGKRVHGFIVTENDKYYGVSTVLDLLHKITQQQIDSARHANPLTLLPGIVPTNQTINALLDARTPFAIVYFDLDNFKPYNDLYGYEAGDNVIKRVAAILSTVYDQQQAAIGHIGGDDFVVVDQSPNFTDRCEQVFTLFSREISTFYSAEHVLAGGIGGVDRQNRPCFFNLLSMSAGIVPPEGTATCHSHIEISDFATEAKKLAKKREGNALFINRRIRGA
ncbi:MAG: GGDEF domain-containing protein, partial [Pseudomonadota bacterium]